MGRLHPPAGREPTQRHAPPAEVGVDTIPEFVGEIERLRAVLWARITDAQRHGPTAPTIGSLSPVR